jgi:alpha-L-rhamnosidase
MPAFTLNRALCLQIYFLFCIMPFLEAQQTLIPKELQCEYLNNPIGIDSPHPRLTWKIIDPRQGSKQSAFQIFIATDSNVLNNQKSEVFHTPIIDDAAQLFNYRGDALKSFTRYYWQVKVWDQNGISSISNINYFETGMMQMSNWKGAWISDTRNIDKKEAPYFRTNFDINKKVKSARAYIVCAGLYELYFNGNKTGDHHLDPMYTRFDRRNLYVTYDITDQLIKGRNTVGVLLGNGWYNHQSTAVWYFHEAPWRARPAFCIDIRLTYDDGSIETISSGKNWKTSTGSVIFNSIYTAEHIDNRLEQPGWNKPEFDDSKWKEVILRSAPSDNIVSQTMHPIRNVDTINPISMNKINDTCWVFDLGRNISGVSKIKLKGAEGTAVKVRHSERLYKDGHTDLSNIDVHYRPTDVKDPFQTDIYTLIGKGEEVFMPHFNYKGFQYVELISSKPLELKKEDLTGYFMHSDVPPIGEISSSNPVLDKIWTATNNSYLSNLFGYPTDCPQREKNGWTGDAQIAVETGLYNFDGITIYEKWMADHRDEQQPNGVLPSIIPSNGWGYEWGNGPDWTSTISIIPWNVYLFYGDTKILKDNYEAVVRYVDHITSISPDGLTDWGLGDWVPVKSKASAELTSSCYYYADVMILSKMAKLLGHADDHQKYSTLGVKIKTAFNNKFLKKETGLYGSGIQTELCVPLYWGLVPDEMKEKVASNLAKRVVADGSHLDVGLLGTKAILNALSENGYADLAYTLASQESYPSWGWWIKNGATTLYENWPIDADSHISMNHIMFGEIGAWMYKGLGGIKPDPEQPGFKNVLLKPNFVKGLDRFSAKHTGPYGEIVSSWKKVGKEIIYDVEIPPNSSASLQLPLILNKKVWLNGKIVEVDRLELESGNYQFVWK